MNCNEAQQNLEPALDGVIDREARRRVQVHVSTCAQCKEKFEQLRHLGTLISETEPTTPSESLDARVMQTFRTHHAHRSPKTHYASRFSDLLISSVRIPVPVFGILLVAALSLVALAYRAGKQNAQQVAVNQVPPPSERLQETHARQEIKAIVPSDKVDPVSGLPSGVPDTAHSYRRTRRSAGKETARLKDEAKENPLKSSTVITSNGMSYSTTAILKGFEPLPFATARIIKGEQR